MLAILEDAVHCILKQYENQERTVRRSAVEAEEWLFSGECKAIFSFLNICTVLDLDPDYIRRGVVQWARRRPAQLKKTRRRSVPLKGNIE